MTPASRSFFRKHRLFGPAFLVVAVSCSPAAAAPLAERASGFAVEHDFRVRDAGFSRAGRAETAGFAADTYVTAATASGSRLLIGTSNRGVLESNDGGKTWVQQSVQKVPMALDTANQRRVYAFDNRAQFLTHKHEILLRSGAAAPLWQPVKINLRRAVIFTAIHRGKSNLYLGTSVNGLEVAPLGDAALEAAITGKKPLALKFTSANAGLPGKPHDKSHFLYEEVQAVYEMQAGDLIVATGPRPALYRRKPGEKRFQRIVIEKLDENFDDCTSVSAVSDENAVLSCRRGIWSGSLKNPQWTFTPHSALVSDIAAYGAYAFTARDGNLITYRAHRSFLTAEKKARMQNAANQRLLYTSGFNWNKRQAAVLKELQTDFWTGLVIDVKDDNGILRYDSEVPVAKAIGAVRPLYKLADVVEKVHAIGKRVVVRLVVFKDPKLFEREGYAIRDAGGGKWVGVPGERWIDPYNPNLLSEYYVPLVKELTARGVDEIQLDYIRFPSDGAVGRCRYSHKTTDYYASEALENFLVGVRGATHLPIGADIYGYNGMYRVPGAIGQDLEVYGRVLDVISPMHYSSHFGDEYMREYPQSERAYQLLLLALSRGVYYAQGEFVMRPWIQAFPMKNSLWGYGKKYFADQIKGSADGGGDGFMFWGKFEHMTLVRETQTK